MLEMSSSEENVRGVSFRSVLMTNFYLTKKSHHNKGDLVETTWICPSRGNTYLGAAFSYVQSHTGREEGNCINLTLLLQMQE